MKQTHLFDGLLSAATAYSVNRLSNGPKVRGSNPGKEIPLFSETSSQPSGLPSLPFNQHQGSFSQEKHPGCNGDHSPPSNVKIKNWWSYTSTPQKWLHSVGKDKFAF
jgi:hypothetical protein